MGRETRRFSDLPPSWRVTSISTGETPRRSMWLALNSGDLMNTRSRRRRFPEYVNLSTQTTTRKWSDLCKRVQFWIKSVTWVVRSQLLPCILVASPIHTVIFTSITKVHISNQKAMLCRLCVLQNLFDLGSSFFTTRGCSITGQVYDSKCDGVILKCQFCKLIDLEKQMEFNYEVTLGWLILHQVQRPNRNPR